MHSSRLHRSDSYMHDRCTRVEDRKIEDPREEEAAARNSVESLIPRLAHRNANFPYRVTGPLANAGWVTVEFQTRGEHPFLTSGSVDITASLGFTSSRFLRDIVASHDEHDAYARFLFEKRQFRFFFHRILFWILKMLEFSICLIRLSYTINRKWPRILLHFRILWKVKVQKTLL